MTTMLLSEAIRLGAMMHPQGFDSLRIWEWKEEDGVINKVLRTCALGAALEAIGEHDSVNGAKSFAATSGAKHWPWVYQQRIDCPYEMLCDKNSLESHERVLPYMLPSVLNIITHLNDYHRWTREQIADWVEMQERKMESRPYVMETPA